MRIEGLEPVALAAACARTPESVLACVVEGLVADVDLALARIWLTGLGDLCEACPMRGDCHDQTICLHLAASAGNPRTGPRDAWSHLEGAFRRYPLGAGKIGRIAATSAPLLIPDVASDHVWIRDPGWARAEGIRSFAGHPLLFHDEVMGVLAVFGRESIDARGFDALRAFAAHTAVALANGRAFDQIAKARDAARLERDCLREEVRAARGHAAPHETSRAHRTLREQIEVAAPTDANVLIFGETGTGKTSIAHAIHDHSGRAEAALARVDCAALTADALEREIFGHTRDAFPAATLDRAGRLEVADGGTLLLDEVGALPLALQTRLLRLLEEGAFERVGDSEMRHVDVRVVAVTNRDLRGEVAARRFREDLYYRLAVISIEVPPLRHRRDEIGPLAAKFLAGVAQRLGKPALRLSLDDVAALEASAWPGNVRELQQVIERAALRARSASLDLDALLAEPDVRSKSEIETEAARKRRERANIEAALVAADGRIYGPDGAAKILGMKPTTLASRIKALGIDKPS
jgi:transcriptional regulator with GAF, ATPase, and Fis domain